MTSKSQLKRLAVQKGEVMQENKSCTPDTHFSGRCPTCGQACACEKNDSGGGDALRDRIEAVLRDYRCDETRDEDGEPLPLADALTPRESDSVAPGKNEIHLLADAIAAAISVPERSGEVERLRSLLRMARSEIRPVVGETYMLCQRIDEAIGAPACDCFNPFGNGLHDVGCSAYFPPAPLLEDVHGTVAGTQVNSRRDGR